LPKWPIRQTESVVLHIDVLRLVKVNKEMLYDRYDPYCKANNKANNKEMLYDQYDPYYKAKEMLYDRYDPYFNKANNKANNKDLFDLSDRSDRFNNNNNNNNNKSLQQLPINVGLQLTETVPNMDL